MTGWISEQMGDNIGDGQISDRWKDGQRKKGRGDQISEVPQCRVFTQAALEHKTLTLQEFPPSGWNHRLHTLEDHRVGGGAGEEGAISEASLQEAAAFSPSSHATRSSTALGGLCPQDQSEDMLKQTNRQKNLNSI